MDCELRLKYRTQETWVAYWDEAGGTNIQVFFVYLSMPPRRTDEAYAHLLQIYSCRKFRSWDKFEDLIMYPVGVLIEGSLGDLISSKSWQEHVPCLCLASSALCHGSQSHAVLLCILLPGSLWWFEPETEEAVVPKGDAVECRSTLGQLGNYNRSIY